MEEKISKIKKNINKNEKIQIIVFPIMIVSFVLISMMIRGKIIANEIFPFIYLYLGVITTISFFTLFFISLKNIKNFQELKKNNVALNKVSLSISYLLVLMFVLFIISYIPLIILK